MLELGFANEATEQVKSSFGRTQYRVAENSNAGIKAVDNFAFTLFETKAPLRTKRQNFYIFLNSEEDLVNTATSQYQMSSSTEICAKTCSVEFRRRAKTALEGHLAPSDELSTDKCSRSRIVSSP